MKPREIKRGRLSGAILCLLGKLNWGAENSDSGVTIYGRPRSRISFADMAAPVRVITSLGFSGVAFPLKDGSEISIVGFNAEQATDFTEEANSALGKYVVRQFGTVLQELQTISEVVERLKSPRRYPSASLLQPFLERSETAMEAMPTTIPNGVLSVEHRDILDKVLAFRTDPERHRENSIQKFVETELNNLKEFFDTIESNPLTPEQRLAVISDEDATLVLAGAGSGKTSVIVAKAAYLIERNIRQSDEILLLAFGKDAATEMAERIKMRSGAAVHAMTFHALGYEIINKVENGAPALAPHASDDGQFRVLLRDILMTEVAKQPDLAELLLNWFSEFYWPYKSEWDFKTKDEYYRYVEEHELRTFKGELVKSFEELEIANWLYRHGVEYEYEPIYEHELPGNGRRVYTPDFRLTECGIYIEHFGVRKSRGPDGSTRYVTAPYVDRERYLEGMEWKRKVHRKHNTTLVETFSFERVEGRLLKALREKLPQDIELAPIPAEQLLSQLSEMGQIDGFTQTLGTFLRHFKSSGVDIERCRARSAAAEDKFRSRSFLKIFESVFEAYQKRLGDRIDFEDMIIRAAEHVEAERYKSPYRHLLVDEFQDLSEGRARLLRALKAQHDDARLFAVGDDWQSIFRFAGSDIHLMRDFGKEFGGQFAGQSDVHRQIDLGRTFRSVDKVALPARRFILQNPLQIEKATITVATTTEPSIKVAYYERFDEEAALREVIAETSNAVKDNAKVLLLGRYHHSKPKFLNGIAETHRNLSLRFLTMHASKGLEADHVVILRASAEKMGFPSGVEDDPLINLVLPETESFPHAEERHLFYVALTRARKSVTILADRQKPSCFVRELLNDSDYETIQIGDPDIAGHRCGACGGRMLAQQSSKGNRYFACEHKKLCGSMLWPCKICEKDLPVNDPNSPDTVICGCGASFPKCSECLDGWLVERPGKFGKFLGCVNYPNCTNTMRIKKAEAAR